MSVLGSSEEKTKFLKNLDEKKLVDLYSDILILEGHTEVKITDGPGDGQRDIHSVDKNDNKYLSQSKFHGDPLKTVSSKELGEVVLGMVKLGYKKGRFVTNAKISPQAKRECLDNYPGYSVEFIEGWELVKRVFENLVLKAIWYDGEALDRVSYVLVIPIIGRDLERDRRLHLLPKGQDSYQGNRLTVGRTQVQVNFQTGSVNTSAFEPYRSPRVRTAGEFGTPRSQSIEAILSGVIYLEDIDELQSKVGTEALSYVQNLYNRSRPHIALRVGMPYLTPLSGESSGARIELKEYDPITFVVQNGAISYEFEWLYPSQDSGWRFPLAAPRASQTSWVRWYNPTLDTCLDLAVISPPSESMRWTLEEQQEFTLKWWNESLFILLPSSIQGNWLESQLPEPTSTYEWFEDSVLCSWLHPNLMYPVRLGMIEPDEYPDEKIEDDISIYNPVNLKQTREDLENILTKAENLGGTLVSAQKARHMIAALNNDPLPEIKNVENASGYLIFYPEVIPSPIDPRSRQLYFTTCWLIPASVGDIEKNGLDEIVEKILNRLSLPFEIQTGLDKSDYSEKSYLIVSLKYKEDLGFEQTDIILQELNDLLNQIITKLENRLKLHFPNIRRATRKYWDDELFYDI